jgi:hypothetical protein
VVYRKSARDGERAELADTIRDLRHERADRVAIRLPADQRISVNRSTAPHASQRLIDVVSRPGFLLQCQTLPHFSHFRSVVLTLHH